jgi:hypothetical protein
LSRKIVVTQALASFAVLLPKLPARVLSNIGNIILTPSFEEYGLKLALKKICEELSSLGQASRLWLFLPLTKLMR